MNTVRVVGVQFAITPRMDENAKKIASLILKTDADFVLFPEMALTGYHGHFSQKAVERACGRIAEACRQSYACAMVGTGWESDEGTYIQTRVFGADGSLLGTHEKIIPTQDDRAFCRPGGELRTFRHAGITFGCLICNDMWVTPGSGPYPDPRLSYQLGKKGAQVIFHSVNSGANASYTAYHESNVQLRALESGVYICTANAVADGPVNCTSGVVSPKGEWLVQCPREGEQTYSADLEIEPEE